MKKGDFVKFKSKNASIPYRVKQRGQQWAKWQAAEFSQQLKKDPFQKMEIIEMTEGYDMQGVSYPVALLTVYRFPVPCKLLVAA